MAQPLRKDEPIYDDQGVGPTSAADRSARRWGMTQNEDKHTSPDDDNSQQDSHKKVPARDRADQKWGMGTNKVADKEANPSLTGGNSLGNAITGGESGLSAPPILNKLTPAPKGFFSQPIKLFGRNVGNRKQGSLIFGGTGLAAVFISMFMMGSSLYLVHVKESILGKNNPVSNALHISMQNRRTRSLFHLLQKGSSKIKADVFAAKAAEAGLTVETNKGVVTRLLYGGKTITLIDDAGAPISKNVTERQFNELLRSESGQAFKDVVDKISVEEGARLVGPVTEKKVWRRLGIVRAFDWIKRWKESRKGTEKELSKEAETGAALASFDETQTSVLKQVPTEQLAAELNLKPGEYDPNSPPEDLLTNLAEDSKKQAKELADATGAAPETLTDQTQTAETLVDNGNLVDNVLLSTTNEAESKKLYTKFIEKIASTKTGSRIIKNMNVLNSIDYTGIPRDACHTKGVLQLVKSTANILLAAQLAKFAVQLFIVSDHQKAGLASSDSIRIMSAAMVEIMGSSSVRSMMSGGSVSAIGVNKYNTGYSNRGVLASVAAFLDRIVGPSECKVFTSTAVEITGPVLSGAATALTFGSDRVITSGLGFWASMGIAVAKEAAFAFAVPLILSVISHTIITGFENPELMGAATMAGVGAYQTMSAGASAGLPATKEVYSQQTNVSAYLRQRDLKKQSFAERYLDISNSESLMARLSLLTPRSFTSTGSLLNTATFSAPFSSIFSFLGAPAYAESSQDQCNDPAVLKYSIATDVFCNPILSYVPDINPDNAETALLNFKDSDGKTSAQINLSGQPVEGSEFAKFIENCFSGRTGLLHPLEVKDDGTSDMNDPTCVVGNDDPQLAWAEPEVFPGYSVPDTRNWFAQKLFPKAAAESQDVVRLPTKKEVFAAWYGYLVDEENMVADINDALPGMPNYVTPSTSTTTASSSTNGRGPDSSTGPVTYPVTVKNIPGVANVGDYKMPQIPGDHEKTLTVCPTKQWTGANKLRTDIGIMFEGKTANDYYNTITCTGGPMHFEGRAQDVYAWVSRNETDKGNSIFGWLISNADLLGIQYVKYWKVEWTPIQGFKCVNTVEQRNQHSNHIHYELNWDGAKSNTPYFTSGQKRDSFITVNQDICPALDPNNPGQEIR